MDILVITGQLILSLSLLVVLHELGHFIPARLFKTRVEKFYLFFDVKFSLLKKKIGDTEYGIGWLPLGGYVKISGMIDESMDKEQLKKDPEPWEFRSKPAWQRLIIMLGGVTVNFILGFFLYGMVLWVWGEDYIPAENARYGIYVDELGTDIGLQDGDRVLKVGEKTLQKLNDREVVREIIINNVSNLTIQRGTETRLLPIDAGYAAVLSSYENKGKVLFGPRVPFIVEGTADDTPAAKAGLKTEDRIIGVNGAPTEYFHEFQRLVRDQYKGKEVTLSVLRGTDTLSVPIKITEEGKIGAYARTASLILGAKNQAYTLGEAMPAGVSKGLGFLNDQLKAFGKMFKGDIKVSESLGGIGSIGQMFGTEWIWQRFWTMTAILSLILAFMNLLPIPALDGGHVMFLLVEAITGRKLSDKFMEWATTAGLIIVLGLVLYANGLDIFRGIQAWLNK